MDRQRNNSIWYEDAGWNAWTLIGLTTAISMMIALIGCGNVIRRSQSPDSPLIRLGNRHPDTKYVGDICGVRGLRPEQIEGIGLVVGLEGTGGEPAPSGQKDYLLRELTANKSTENAKTALASKNTSMVMVKGLIPAGAKKGDMIDLEVIAPPGTNTSSLKYGRLLKTDLRPMAFLSRNVKMGNAMGKAQGPVLVDELFESSRDGQGLLRGRILGGGQVNADRELTLVVTQEESAVKITRSIAHSINQRYTTQTSSGLANTANPATDRIIQLVVPEQYQHNLGRFVQALQALSYEESSQNRNVRLDDLEKRLQEPELAQRAAIELEAIGQDGISVLQPALRHPDFEIRFYAAEALAYLGREDGVTHLRLAAETEPAFRWHALTALASAGGPQAKQALRDLLDVSSAETRYGALRALRACSPDDRELNGEFLANEFYFQAIPGNADGLVHFSRTQRPEIVVFGNERVSDSFLFVEPGLTVKGIDVDRVQVTRFDPVDGEIRLTCSSRISEMIKTLARFRVGYTSMLELCREADGQGMLNARLVINAVPKIGSKSMKDSVNGGSVPSDKYMSAPIPDLFSDRQIDEDWGHSTEE